MKKFKFLVKYGLAKRLKRKSFIISNIVIFILLAVIINLPAIIQSFDDDNDLTSLNIYVENHTSETTLIDDLSAKLNEPFESDFYIIEPLTETFDETAFWDNSDMDVVLIFNSKTDIEIYSKHPTYNATLSSYIELLFIDYEIPGYQSPVFQENFAPDYEDPDQTEVVSALSSFIALPLFFLITMATQIIGADIIEEKSSKAIETIIASVPTKTHFLSKITSSISFVLIQGGLLIVYATIAAVVFGGRSEATGESMNLLVFLGEVLPNWPVILVYSLLFMVIGTLFYLTFAAMLASMAVSQEDYAQFQSPIMMTLLIGFYIALFAGYINGGILLKITSFIPFFTPVVAPVAMASGALSVLEASIALVVNFVFLIGGLYVMSPVYRVAILNYDQTKFMKRVKGYFKKAFQK